jgi:Holliday junction resolvasome RuvABC endonuclease subunit
MKVLGLDPSLTGTGIVVLNSRGRIIDHTTVKTKPIRGTDRLTVIEAVVRNWLRHLEPGDVVVMESPSYGSRTGNQHELAGLWWILMRAIVDRKNMLGGKLTIYTIAPRARAKYATGNGNANKIEVMSAVHRAYPQVDNSWDDNACDALVLAHMAFVKAGRTPAYALSEALSPDVVKEYAA